MRQDASVECGTEDHESITDVAVGFIVVASCAIAMFWCAALRSLCAGCSLREFPDRSGSSPVPVDEVGGAVAFATSGPASDGERRIKGGGDMTLQGPRATGCGGQRYRDQIGS